MVDKASRRFVTPPGLEKPVSSVGTFGEAAMVFERARLRPELRIAHLKRQGRTDADTEELHARVKALEDFADGMLTQYVCSHPTAHWWRRVTGCHTQIMGKVLYHIENFGRFYPVGDLMIPASVSGREVVRAEDESPWVWVNGIERFVTPSKMMKYAGLIPPRVNFCPKCGGTKNTANDVRVCPDCGGRLTEEAGSDGEMRSSNADFRTILFRLMQFGFLFNAKSSRYYERYVAYKLWKQKKEEAAGKRIMKTPKGRFCVACSAEKEVPKDTRFCPDCNTKLGLKVEPEGVIFAGHLDMMARRWTIKLFLCHLWVIWRQAEGLSIRAPYPIEHMPEEHVSVIIPWDMCDLAEVPPTPPKPDYTIKPRRQKRTIKKADESPTAGDTSTTALVS